MEEITRSGDLGGSKGEGMVRGDVFDFNARIGNFRKVVSAPVVKEEQVEEAEARVDAPVQGEQEEGRVGDAGKGTDWGKDLIDLSGRAFQAGSGLFGGATQEKGSVQLPVEQPWENIEEVAQSVEAVDEVIDDAAEAIVVDVPETVEPAKMFSVSRGK